MIKSAASAASLGTKKSEKKIVKNEGNNVFFRAFYIGIPGLIQKFKVPKWVCRWTLASVCSGQPFFAIFGPARGQIYGERPKTCKKNRVLALLGREAMFVADMVMHLEFLLFLHGQQLAVAESKNLLISCKTI